MHTDEYATQQARQNSGLLCKHCGSPSGHFKHCPLICRETAEAHSALPRGYVQASLTRSYMGGKLDGILNQTQSNRLQSSALD